MEFLRTRSLLPLRKLCLRTNQERIGISCRRRWLRKVNKWVVPHQDCNLAMEVDKETWLMPDLVRTWVVSNNRCIKDILEEANNSRTWVVLEHQEEASLTAGLLAVDLVDQADGRGVVHLADQVVDQVVDQEDPVDLVDQEDQVEELRGSWVLRHQEELADDVGFPLLRGRRDLEQGSERGCGNCRSGPR